MGVFSTKFKAARCPVVTAVVVAGGTGTRFRGDKLFAPLVRMPVLAHTLLAFERSPMVTEIVVAARSDMLAEAGNLCREYGIEKARLIVPGGETRLLSSYAGVMAASSDSGVIAIHDGARPLVTDKIIEDTIWAAYRHSAAVPAIPVRDTIKKAAEHIVLETPDRSSLYAVQTPQCFQADLIRAALADAQKHAPEVTDDCMAVERVGGQIWLTEGSEENIKITTPLDLALAELILQRREA